MIIPILLANLHCAVWPFYFVLYLPYIAEYILALTCDTKIYYWFAIKRNKAKLKRLVKKGEKDVIEKQEAKLAQLELDKEKIRRKYQKRRQKPYKVIFPKKSQQ